MCVRAFALSTDAWEGDSDVKENMGEGRDAKSRVQPDGGVVE